MPCASALRQGIIMGIRDVCATFLFVGMTAISSVSHGASYDPKSQGSSPSAAPQTQGPRHIIAARCSRVPCKLEDDLTITLEPPRVVGEMDPRIQIAIGSHLGPKDDWKSRFAYELQPSELRSSTAPSAPNDRIVSISSFAGDWRGSPLLDALQETAMAEIPITLAPEGADGSAAVGEIAGHLVCFR
jgi:hypothetical protein